MQKPISDNFELSLVNRKMQTSHDKNILILLLFQLE